MCKILTSDIKFCPNSSLFVLFSQRKSCYFVLFPRISSFLFYAWTPVHTLDMCMTVVKLCSAPSTTNCTLWSPLRSLDQSSLIWCHLIFHVSRCGQNEAIICKSGVRRSLQPNDITVPTRHSSQNGNAFEIFIVCASFWQCLLFHILLLLLDRFGSDSHETLCPSLSSQDAISPTM